MIAQTFHQSKWVFSKGEDLVLFGGATLLAIAASFYVESFANYFWMFILFDQPHVFTTYFYTYTSDRFSSKFKVPLILLPLICFAVSLLMWKGISDDFAYAVLSNFSAFHFAKQQAAWFFISSAKEGKSQVAPKWEKIVDKLVIYASVAGPLLLSMTDVIGRSGWRKQGDLIQVPLFLEWPIYIISAIAWLAYLAIQIQKYRVERKITWGKHFHLVNALFIWSIYRLTMSPQLSIIGQLLIVFGHSFPYIYLGLRYYESRQTKERFWPGIKNLKVMALMVVAAGILISYLEVISESKWYANGIVPCIWLGLIFSHFLIDTFMWKRETHPEGLQFLKDRG